MGTEYENLGALTSPTEFVEYYYTQVRDHFDARGLQISKQGFIGFFLHVMGFNQYDVKYYYDTLFRESFLATADNEDNLKLHASIYGYETTTIVPSSLVGSLSFYIDQLPVSQNDIDNVSISELKVMIGDVEFMMESTYTIYGDICEIVDSRGEITHIPYDSTTGNIALIDFNQYQTESIAFTLPYYVFGTHYQKIIELGITDASIYQYDIQVKEDGEWVDYSVSTVKFYATPDDKVVFSRTLVNNRLLLEFGSGVNGKFIPESDIRITLRYTHGADGNVSDNTVTPIDGKFLVFDTSGDQIYSGSVTSLINVHVDYSTGGINELEHNDLRHAIIDYVQSRNNLISKDDFYNILSKHLSDFILLFRKINIIDNTIYAFVPFKDKYLNPILSKSISVPYIQFNNSNKPIVYKPSFSIGGSDYISPFIYMYDTFTRTFAGYLYREKYSTYFSGVENIIGASITLPLNLVFEYQSANRTTRIVVQSYEKISNFVIYLDIPLLGVYECMDVFDDNNQEFLYINDLYDGLIHEKIDVKVHIFLNTVKHFVYTVKDIYLLQDLSDILILGLYEFLPDYAEDNDEEEDGTGVIGSTEDGVGWVFTGGGSPDSLVGGDGWFLPQTGFAGMTGGNGVPGWKPDLPYIFMSDIVMHIPVMLYDVYNTDMQYYDQKFINNLGQISIEENRMISDDFQIRFLNTEVVEQNIFKHITVQQHDFRLQLPLKLQVNIGVAQDVLIQNNINAIDFKEELVNNLATQLRDKYTGTAVSFYRTQIVDIVHNIEWVKYCDVFVYDSTEGSPNEIFDANLELIDQSRLETGMTKYEAATFCPIYIWWDLDNINIELIFE